MLTILPVVIVVAVTVVVVTTCVCWLQRQVSHRRSKLIPTRTEYNVNYVHVSEPSLQSDLSGTAAAESRTGIHLPQNSKLSVTPCTRKMRTLNLTALTDYR